MSRWTAETDVFAEHRIDEQLAKALDRKVWLPSGGYLVIDRTEAMVVVDVNTGKFTGAGGNLEETVTKNNLEAAEEIVRQLRLRDLGGIIVIDFIDMVLESNRDLVLRRLLECLGRDRTKHQVAEVTSLGPGPDDPQAGRPGPARGVRRDLRGLQRPRRTTSTPSRWSKDGAGRRQRRRRPREPGRGGGRSRGGGPRPTRPTSRRQAPRPARPRRPRSAAKLAEPDRRRGPGGSRTGRRAEAAEPAPKAPRRRRKAVSPVTTL